MAGGRCVLGGCRWCECSSLGAVLAAGGVDGGGESVVAAAVAVGAGACGQGLAGCRVGQNVHACSAAEAGAAQDVDVHVRRIRRGVGVLGCFGWCCGWGMRVVDVVEEAAPRP